jgi:hypothetical protein
MDKKFRCASRQSVEVPDRKFSIHTTNHRLRGRFRSSLSAEMYGGLRSWVPQEKEGG